ncbi:MAG: SIR2 family protein [Gemmatimonadetes bacterium]|nr:SIR2 family protein [Gemmatimonadota bacterium]
MKTPDDLSFIRTKPFSDVVEKLEELLVQGAPAFLIGAGCSRCAGLPLTAELTRIAMDSENLDDTSKAILAGIQTLFDGATISNIEDYLSELVDLIAIAERRTERGVPRAQMTIADRPYSVIQLRTAAKQIKESILNAVDKEVEIETHRKFIRAVHRPVRVGKATTGSAVDYLVLNYDTVIEDALAIERVTFSDGIEGGVTGWWNPDTLDRNDLAARVLKLHGSVDWCEVAGDSLPRRIAPNLQIQDMRDRRILIAPASTKYRETQLDPFAQLADRARRVLRPAHGTERVLVVCGYSFGDAHINIEIDRALHECPGELTVIAFSSENEPVGLLEKWNKDVAIRDQVLIFAKQGFFHGDTAFPTNCDLPWWKFENVVRLLGGER